MSEGLVFQYESANEDLSQFEGVVLRQPWKGFPAGQKMERLTWMGDKVWVYFKSGTGTLEFTIEGTHVTHQIEGEETLDWLAQVAFDLSTVGQGLEDSPNKFAFGEIWKNGWLHGKVGEG